MNLDEAAIEDVKQAIDAMMISPEDRHMRSRLYAAFMLLESLVGVSEQSTMDEFRGIGIGVGVAIMHPEWAYALWQEFITEGGDTEDRTKAFADLLVRIVPVEYREQTNADTAPDL